MVKSEVTVHSFDRGMIKWLPFNSVVSSKQMIASLMEKRNKAKMPYLSDEQKEIIEKKIIVNYYEKKLTFLDYYYDDKIIHTTGYIKKIDSIYHRIYFNHQILLFDQIIKID